MFLFLPVEKMFYSGFTSYLILSAALSKSCEILELRGSLRSFRSMCSSYSKGNSLETLSHENPGPEPLLPTLGLCPLLNNMLLLTSGRSSVSYPSTPSTSHYRRTQSGYQVSSRFFAGNGTKGFTFLLLKKVLIKAFLL